MKNQISNSLQKAINKLMSEDNVKLKKPVNLNLTYKFRKEPRYMYTAVGGTIFAVIAGIAISAAESVWGHVGVALLLTIAAWFFISANKEYKKRDTPEYGTASVTLYDVVECEVKEDE